MFEFFILSLQMVFKIFNVSSLFFRAALEKKTAGMVSAALPVRAAEKLAPAQYIRYTPSQQVKNVFIEIFRGSFNYGSINNFTTVEFDICKRKFVLF